MRSRLRTLARRLAANMLNDYAPPHLSHAAELVESLEAVADRAAPGGEWAGFSAEIARALRVQGADQFLRLPPIARTVHPRIRSPGAKYLSYLFHSRCFSSTLQKALTESPVGRPLLSPHYPLSSPLLIQHGYHLIRLLESTDFDLAKAQLVADFGAGYGSFFRLLRNLGYRNRYLICDLPVMCALQRFYLRNVFPDGPDGQPPANLRWASSDIAATLRSESAALAPSLFIATWSLSETPAAVRAEVAPALAGFDYVLCAYQRAFGSYDNVQYFRSLAQALPQFNWQHSECAAYRNNFYLIGQRR